MLFTSSSSINGIICLETLNLKSLLEGINLKVYQVKKILKFFKRQGRKKATVSWIKVLRGIYNANIVSVISHRRGSVRH